MEQAAAVRTHSDLQVGEYSDSEKTTTWTDQHWSREIAENQVAARALRGLLSSMTADAAVALTLTRTRSHCSIPDHAHDSDAC